MSDKTPLYAMPIYKDYVYMALHRVDCSPALYALALPWTKRGIVGDPTPLIYTFKTIGLRDDYYATLMHVMRYQHTSSFVQQIISAYQSDLDDFKRRIAELEKQKTR